MLNEPRDVACGALANRTLRVPLSRQTLPRTFGEYSYPAIRTLQTCRTHSSLSPKARRPRTSVASRVAPPDPPQIDFGNSLPATVNHPSALAGTHRPRENARRALRGGRRGMLGAYGRLSILVDHSREMFLQPKTPAPCNRDRVIRFSTQILSTPASLRKIRCSMRISLSPLTHRFAVTNRSCDS